MADDTNPNETTGPVRPSGNRWEPAPAAAAPGPAAATSEPVGATDAVATQVAATQTTTRTRRFRPGAAGTLAGTAAGALLVGGLGGFGIGYAVGDHGGHDREGWGNHEGREQGFGPRGGMGGPGGGQVMPGQPGGQFQGQLPDDQQDQQAPDQTDPSSGSTSGSSASGTATS